MARHQKIAKLFDEDFWVTRWRSQEVAKKVYPAVSVAVKAGDVVITYPVGSINFYGFEFVASGTSGISNIQASEAANEGATFNLLGQKVASNAKGLVIKNGKKFINK